MLASLSPGADAPLDDPQLLYEPKYDGIRAIAEVSPPRWRGYRHTSARTGVADRRVGHRPRGKATRAWAATGPSLASRSRHHLILRGAPPPRHGASAYPEQH